MKKPKHKNYWENAFGFGIFGIFLICCSWDLAWKQTEVFFTGECVEGTVKGTESHRIRPRGRAPKKREEYGVIAYTTKDGRAMQELAPGSYTPGEKVQVYYKASNPAHMRVLAPYTFRVAIFTLVGAGMLGVSLCSLLLALRATPERAGS